MLSIFMQQSEAIARAQRQLDHSHGSNSDPQKLDNVVAIQKGDVISVWII